MKGQEVTRICSGKIEKAIRNFTYKFLCVRISAASGHPFRKHPDSITAHPDSRVNKIGASLFRVGRHDSK